MRRLKQWSAEITADVLTNILQPGHFAQLDQNLTIPEFCERLPGGQLAGVFIDDRRDPKERVSIVADHGTVMKNGDGTSVPSVLEDGNLQRFEIDKRDSGTGGVRPLRFRHVEILQPGATMWRWAFASAICGNLLSPADDDPVYSQIPGQFRARSCSDRFMAPLYPFAFAALTFAFLACCRAPPARAATSRIGSSILVPCSRCAWGDLPAPIMAVVEIEPLAPIVQYLMLLISDRRQPPGSHRRRHRAGTAGRAGRGDQSVERTAAAAVPGRPAAACGAWSPIPLGAISPAASWSRRSACSPAFFVLLVLVDYIEMVRKTSGLVSASAVMVAEDLPRCFGCRNCLKR